MSKLYGYEVIGDRQDNNGNSIPLLDVPMMSDERYEELAREQAVHNYTKIVGRKPPSVEIACMWQQTRIEFILTFGDVEWDKEKEQFFVPSERI